MGRAGGWWFAELADTRLRQSTWPEVEHHRGYIADMLKIGVTQATIHQRLRDVQGLHDQRAVGELLLGELRESALHGDPLADRTVGVLCLLRRARVISGSQRAVLAQRANPDKESAPHRFNRNFPL